MTPLESCHETGTSAANNAACPASNESRAQVPLFRFRLEKTPLANEVYALDLPSREMADTTTKYAARYLASRHIRTGSLDLSQNVVMEDEAGMLLGSWPVRDFVSVS